MDIKTIQDTIGEQIAKLGPQLESMIVARLVDRELEKRTPAIVQGLDKVSELEGELKKLSYPDIKTLNADGSVKDQSYSPKRFEETKKLKERLNKLHGAIAKAFDHGDLKDLNQLLQSKSDKAEGGAKDTGEAG